jgi:hypothetical protein
VLFRGDAKAARVYELTQNLSHAGITVLDRAKSLYELAQTTLGKAKTNELAQPGGRQPGEKGIGKTARELGYTRDDIRRCCNIARICSRAMGLAIEYELDDTESKLLKIAKEKGDEDQIAMAKELRKKKTPAKNSATKPAKKR